MHLACVPRTSLVISSSNLFFCSEILKNQEETRTLYKYMKSNHLGINSVDFYLQFAKMELISGSINKSESVLKNGLEVLKNNTQLLSALQSLETLGTFSCSSKLPQNNLLGSINFGLLTPASMENNSQDSFAKPINKVKRFGLAGPPKRINNNEGASPNNKIE